MLAEIILKGNFMTYTISLILFLSLIFLVLVCCFYILYRNHKIYYFCGEVLNRPNDDWKKLPKYNDMVCKYWYEWDFEKFLTDERYNK